MTIAAAASSVVAKNHGCEFGGHGGVVFHVVRLLSLIAKKCMSRTFYLTRDVLGKSLLPTYFTCTIRVFSLLQQLLQILQVQAQSLALPATIRRKI